MLWAARNGGLISFRKTGTQPEPIELEPGQSRRINRESMKLLQPEIHHDFQGESKRPVFTI